MLANEMLRVFVPFLPQSSTGQVVGLMFLCSGIWAFGETSSQASQEKATWSQLIQHKAQRRLLVIIAVIGAVWLSTSFLAPPIYVDHHPIETLMATARTQHDEWEKQAASSRSLAEAVGEYQRRYHRHPPPLFDKWYNFAVSRNSTVIDDYDGMMKDLAPFAQQPPYQLRRSTRKILVNAEDDMGGISIRSGEALPFDNMVGDHLFKSPGDHTWMLEGIIDMISKFQQHLPDMDLAFNLNDEPRVSGSRNSFLSLVETPDRSEQLQEPLSTAFDSTERHASWHDAAVHAENSPPVFEEASFQNIFARYGASACSSSSDSRWYSDSSRFCTSCVASHSRGMFLANWTSSTDTCTQLDLGRHHGFYASPAAFKGSHLPLPVFSQSKAPYFADILYPSPWNYLNKAEYAPTADLPDPPFAEKSPTLFWRGATSEGFSHHSGWRGFTRQRFVNTVSFTTAPQLILLPSGPSGEYAYQPIPAAALRQSIDSSVRFNPTVRCWPQDCAAQLDEFSPLAPNADFQSHWAHAYLLDLDGAGFSGRFLPFLRSRSLPFKAALFREWYDDRVRAWRHFVPLDLRAHGLWATLVYYAGFKGTVRGRELVVPPQEKAAEEIASAGKAWAERVLRKEDMEVYMFRLLLEWGRLTDDRRDELGFVLRET